MRWRIETEANSEPTEVHLIEIYGDAYTFKVGKEKITLHSPKVFPFSISAKEIALTFEAWNKDQWRAVKGASTYSVRALSWEASGGTNHDEIRTQMPGRVLKLFVKPGDEVKAGQVLIIVEAMKMENEIRATHDAKVKEIAVSSGQSLESGALLIRLE